MKQIVSMALVLLLAGIANHSLAFTITKKGETMTAKGKFEINLSAQEDNEAPVGRMIIKKSYQGDMVGSGVGQMISKRTESGSALYYAIEEFSGSVNGKSGAFTLVHKGFINKESQTLEVEILEGSGTGDFENISGSMVIVQDENGHTYELTYELPNP